MLHKKVSLQVGTLLVIILTGYIAYYFLLNDHTFSISSIIASTQHLALKKHILVLAFLPIYIAAMIFGSGLIGLYLASRLHHFLVSKKSR